MAKTSIQITQAVAANATVFPLTGKRFENVYRTGLLTLIAKATTGTCDIEMFVADRNAIEGSQLTVAAGALLVPDHVVIDDVEAFVGEKIQIKLTDTSGAANSVDLRLILDDNVRAIR